MRRQQRGDNNRNFYGTNQIPVVFWAGFCFPDQSALLALYH